MQMSPYVMFNGNAEEAFAFYQQVLGGELMKMGHDDSPEKNEMSEKMKGKILHIRLTANDFVLMGSDCPPEHFEGVKGVYISLVVESEDEADRIFNAFAENGQIQMPIGKTFWAARFGMCVDRFGVAWMINGGETM